MATDPPIPHGPADRRRPPAPGALQRNLNTTGGGSNLAAAEAFFSFGKGQVVEIRRVFRVKRVPRVAATTHSWDAVAALARAAAAEQDQDVMLLRLERGADPASAVAYSGDELLTAARQGIEVR